MHAEVYFHLCDRVHNSTQKPMKVDAFRLGKYLRCICLKKPKKTRTHIADQTFLRISHATRELRALLVDGDGRRLTMMMMMEIHHKPENLIPAGKHPTD